MVMIGVTARTTKKTNTDPVREAGRGEKIQMRAHGGCLGATGR